MLLTLLQSVTYLVVRRANREHALAQIESSLRAGTQVFKKLIDQRNQQITSAAAILSRDHAFLEAFAGADQDRATTLSALESLRGRINADLILIASLKNQLLFDTRRPDLESAVFPFPKLLNKAETDGSAYAFVILDKELYAMAATPLLAPDPIAWLCPAFHIDDQFAHEIKTYSDLEITFLHSADDIRLLASTFEADNRHSLLAILQRRLPRLKQIVDLKFGGEHFISYSLPLVAAHATAIALLQRSLDKELAPYLRLERTYLFLALAGLLVSVGVGIWIARSVSRPVLQLAEGTHKIGEGDYSHRIRVRTDDEIGLLATAFNHMSEGLAERDQVRDLLGKVVSPAVATELLRKDVVLGGEEREVTILFSDLRRFTSMSEARSPQEMVGILNHYFTRMSAIVEAHGGVVDKYVGDAMMALFGAPLAGPDDADHALETALEMSDALDELNRQWREQGRNALDVGIGINTDVVVAGNMGSQTRLNYTVIGDGVNLASRLEELTKTPEYQARIIVSSSTLEKAKKRYRTRRLGEVAVKGKQKPTEIYALLPPEI
ncbi:MAG TPA: adenylate/guanylate cyclase domain-containing protein [Candidatus Acidoferrum sp.]|nr:adenylate/guanylate cyclase domain-containing protein [Candidatus Acidoferrum sp.]